MKLEFYAKSTPLAAKAMILGCGATATGLTIGAIANMALGNYAIAVLDGVISLYSAGAARMVQNYFGPVSPEVEQLCKKTDETFARCMKSLDKACESVEATTKTIEDAIRSM